MSHKPGLLGAQDNSLDGDDGLYVVPSMAAAPENTLPSTPVVIPDEAIEAQAAVSASNSSSGGISSVVSETSGGLTINLIFDAAALAAPASFRAGIQQAAALLSAAISDHITLNFNIDYSGTGGGAAAAPDNGQWMSYSAVKADLVNNASASDATFIALPTGSTIQGQSSVAVWNAQLKLWGLLGANDTSTDDGSATFATDINPNLLVGVALHELTHAMGRVPYGPQPDIFDFYRFTSPGVRLFTGGSTASAAYFSLNGGSTKIADYGQSSDASDFLNSGVQGANDPFNEYYTGNTLQQLTSVDLQQLDALGFHLTANTFSTIEAQGSTSLVQVGYHYFLNSVASGSGPELTYQGAPVTLGEFGAWTPIGAEAVSGGYDVAWKNTSSGLYIIWNVDGSGNYVKDIINGASATNAVLESYETTFHQDLNGDGTIGLVGSTIEGLGTTSLMQVGVNYLLNSSAGGTGPELTYQGAPVTSGEFGAWTPIGAEAVSGGYDVAWKNTSSGLYIIWNVDGSGNYVKDIINGASATNGVLESYETIFHQDLNGDGTIGLVGTTIEGLGATSLTQVGANYLLNPVAGGTGPELMYQGAPVYSGEFGAWTPIGAEAVSSGYDVAWMNTSSGLYIIWNVDSSGNYVRDIINGASSTNAVLESYETTFHQDLNGDGTIGLVGTTIEGLGTTSLMQLGVNYLLNPTAGGTGPELMYQGTPVYSGEFGAWTPIGAEAVSSGYDVAWKNTSSGLYIIWNVDSSGNYVKDIINGAPTTNAVLESYEITFHQDLNGDGTIGLAGTNIETSGATSLLQVESNYFMVPVGGNSGPGLMYQGAPVYSGEFGAWTPVGAEAVSGGYDVAWKNTTSGLYIIWNVDGSGNYVKDLLNGVSGTASAFEAYENTFHQDLNGDGTIGIPSGTAPATTPAATQSVQTSLVPAQDNFHFSDSGNGGTPVIAATILATSAGPVVPSSTVHDTFVFAPNFSPPNSVDFAPVAQSVQSATTGLNALIAAAHDDHPSGGAVFDQAHTSPPQPLTVAQQLAQLHDFHFV